MSLGGRAQLEEALGAPTAETVAETTVDAFPTPVQRVAIDARYRRSAIQTGVERYILLRSEVLTIVPRSASSSGRRRRMPFLLTT